MFGEDQTFSAAWATVLGLYLRSVGNADTDLHRMSKSLGHSYIKVRAKRGTNEATLRLHGMSRTLNLQTATYCFHREESGIVDDDRPSTAG